jgi:FtsH-binding integral membrane protein
MIEPIHLGWSYYWPFALVVAWAIFDILRHHKKSELQLRLAGYAAGVIISVSVLVGVQFPPLVEGIQRNVKQHWFLGLLAAVIASCIVANRFWVLRQHARVWAVYGTWLCLHFVVGVPALGKLGRITSGIKEALFLCLTFCEGWILVWVLKRVTACLPKTQPGITSVPGQSGERHRPQNG